MQPQFSYFKQNAQFATAEEGNPVWLLSRVVFPRFVVRDKALEPHGLGLNPSSGIYSWLFMDKFLNLSLF